MAKEFDERNEINRILLLDPLDLTEVDYDRLIKEQRRLRALVDSGYKPQKIGTESLSGGDILAKLKMVAPKKITRRA